MTTALQIALVDLLDSWNVKAIGTIGHSSGEIAAEYSAGLISREYAWSLAYFRGQVCAINDSKGPGALEDMGMLAVTSSASSCRRYINRHDLGADIFIGCINSADNTTLTGLKRSLDLLERVFRREKILARALSVTCAYHSPFMEPLATLHRQYLVFLDIAKEPQPKLLQIPMYFSSSSEESGHLEVVDPEYWIRNLISPVNFTGAMNTALKTQATYQQNAWKSGCTQP